MSPMQSYTQRRSPMAAETHACSNGRRRRLVLKASVVAAVSLFSTSSGSVSAFTALPLSATSIPPPTTTTTQQDFESRRNPLRLGMSKDKNNNKNNRNLSNSEQGRREEERRRKERKDEVVIGKTSAKKGAKDYAIDPEATEREYVRQLSREDQLIHKYTDDGMEALKSLRLEVADQEFSKVFELRPDAYVWLAGIVKFYMDDLEGAASIFARSTTYFETKFGPMEMGPASEERIWRSAAELKYLQTLKRSERKQYLTDKQKGNPTPIAQVDKADDDIGKESRKVHRLATELFDASVAQQKAAEAVARAHLLSVAGTDDDNNGGTLKSLDIKKRKLYASYFLALHYDVTGEVEEGKKWIKKAFKLCSNSMGKSSDILDTLPLLHMTVRDWFDDDPYDEDDINMDDDLIESPDFEEVDDDYDEDDQWEKITNSAKEAATSSEQHMSDAYSDPILEASIMEDVEKMKFDEIREALRIRGISVTGSKDTLKERLFISLMDDAGFQSGFAP